MSSSVLFSQTPYIQMQGIDIERSKTRSIHQKEQFSEALRTLSREKWWWWSISGKCVNMKMRGLIMGCIRTVPDSQLKKGNITGKFHKELDYYQNLSSMCTELRIS